MTPRKWTAADVTEEDMKRLTRNIGHEPQFWGDERQQEVVAACWNRLEEGRASDCGPVGHLRKDVLLRQALEALREVQSGIFAEYGKANVFLVNFPLASEAIAALEKEVGA